MRSSTPRWLWKLDAEHRFLITLGMALLVFLTLPQLGLGIRTLISWNVGTGSLLMLIWSVILTAHVSQIRRRAQTDDTNRVVIGFLVIGAASASLFAVVFLLKSSKQLPPAEEALAVVLSVLAIVGSWLVVHSTFCLRYAHHYYSNADGDMDAEPAGGMEFPNQDQPDYLDFAYFAFTIGMTAQTSDVQVTSSTMRRLTLAHGLLSFGFNTVVVALSINIISQLA